MVFLPPVECSFLGWVFKLVMYSPEIIIIHGPHGNIYFSQIKLYFISSL